MPEWWTYRLEDFVMFSGRAYYRSFELYNARVWPTQLLAGAAGVAILVLLRRREPWRGRFVAALLAIAWVWVAWGYFLGHHAAINWAARYFAAAFAVQAVLLVWEGVARDRFAFGGLAGRRWLAAAGLSVLAVAVLPAVAPIVGRGWGQAELFGLAPDPTAIGTLGVVLLSVSRPRWHLLVIPTLWCLVSAGTLRVLGAGEWVVPLLAAAAVIIIATSAPREEGPRGIPA